MVLVEIVVEVEQCLLTVVLSVQADRVGVGDLRGFEGAGHKGHELAEDADAAVPEGGLGHAASDDPATGGRVVGLHHVRQLEGVVVAA